MKGLRMESLAARLKHFAGLWNTQGGVNCSKMAGERQGRR